MLKTFLQDKKNAKDILEAFNDIEHSDKLTNYFSIREAMKLEYEILVKHEDLQAAYAEEFKYLIECMTNLSDEGNDAITY